MDRKQLADAIDAVQSHSELGNLVSRVLWPFLDELNALNEHVQRCCDEAVKEAREEWEAEKPTLRMDRTADSLLAMSKRIGELKQALAAEQAARAAAERERDEYREGFHAMDEMYKAAVAIFKEQRRVLGVPEGDGVPITDHCADLVRRLRVAREALRSAEVMLRGARDRLAASGATMGVYDATLAEVQAALADPDAAGEGEKGAVV